MNTMKVFSVILLVAGYSAAQLHEYNSVEGNSIDYCGAECFEQLKPLLDHAVDIKQRGQEYGAQIELLNKQLVVLRGEVDLLRNQIVELKRLPHPIAGDSTSTTPTSTTTRTTATNASLPTRCASYEESGTHQIQVPGTEPFRVYCQVENMNEPAWIVVLRRQNGDQLDFQRDWASYRNGFGNLSEDHFLGLEKLYSLTRSVPYELLIKLTDFNDNERYALYTNLRIGNEQEKYRLKSLGGYSGNAGEAMSYHLGNEFSTHDMDNDRWAEGKCTTFYRGAWWYGWDTNSNLMGQYYNCETNDRTSIWWFTWKGYSALKSVQMMIRPTYTLMQD